MIDDYMTSLDPVEEFMSVCQQRDISTLVSPIWSLSKAVWKRSACWRGVLLFRRGIMGSLLLPPLSSVAESSGSSAQKQPIPPEPEQIQKPNVLQHKASEKPRSHEKSPARRKRKQSRSPRKDKERKSSKKQKRSKSPHRRYRRRSTSRSRSVRKRSRSRSAHRRSRRSRSRSASRSRGRPAYNQRDRWKREPSHSPVLILRKKRSPSRKDRSRSTSPKRISELDKDQLLEIAKANAAAMCVKAGMPIPASLRSAMLPLALPSMAMNAAMASMTAASVTAALSNMGTLSSLLPLPSISNKPPILLGQSNTAALEEVKKKVAKQANSISIKEFTDVRAQSVCVSMIRQSPSNIKQSLAKMLRRCMKAKPTPSLYLLV
ncbi:hypothetical protein AMECASPLE_036674 [Ameca splendens]|uniref:Uncharacterized protein n=1 Tax=Ameca splendens TaxID=208324 RepID=A0ABV0Y884_9TELE